MLLALSLVGPAVAAELPAGTTVPAAVTVDLTREGLEALVAAAPALVPPTLEIPDPAETREGWECISYMYDIDGLEVGLDIIDASIVPMTGSPGYLDVTASLQVRVNDATNPFLLEVEALCIGGDCDAYVEPFMVDIHTTLALAVNPKTSLLDATVGPLDVTNHLSSDDIHLDGCAIGTVEDVLNFFSLSLYDLILPTFEDQLLGAVDDFGPEIETLIEDAFAQATFSDTVALGEAELEIDIAPSDVLIVDEGVRIVLEGRANTSDVAACIEALDPGSSFHIDGPLPDVGVAPANVDPAFHAGVNASDEFVNQALYSAWRGGLLCFNAGPEVGLSTTLLGLVVGEELEALFPTPKDVFLVTRPATPPTLALDTDHDAALAVTGLGIDFYGDLDHRMARLFGVELTTDVGLNVELDPATGALAFAIDLDDPDSTTDVTHNDLLPNSADQIASGFTNLLVDVAGQFIPTEALSFALPAFEGLGVTSIETGAAGDERDWLGLYASVGAVKYASAGCSGDKKKKGEACAGGGCTVAQSGGRFMALVWLPLMAAAMRRRR